ncbi:hypothetical protein [Nodularia sphaerocarpa]|uniref:hypothetical protein n=1 Tax=Nodularia sphaerocarpa TaxID=137816 RepID=UPI001EFABA64|nr:hypothetical protein [Nodularia sphaerocarpa]MDB9375755.1 hypothetical protein [Nodularia sphaerocarpa CS-585]
MTRRNRKRGKQRGQRYNYRPRRKLIYNLAVELGLTERAVLERIREERLFLLQEIYGTDQITAVDI